MNLNSAVSDTQLNEFDADVVAIAVGADWQGTNSTMLAPDGQLSDDLAGVNVVAFEDAVLDVPRLGPHVVLVDETGSYEPLGLAEKILLAGARVTLVTSQAVAGEATRATMDYAHVMPRLHRLGLRIVTEAVLVRTDHAMALLKDNWGRSLPTLDNISAIVFTTARTSRLSTFRDATLSRPNMLVIGDAFAPRETLVVMHDAYFAGAQL